MPFGFVRSQQLRQQRTSDRLNDPAHSWERPTRDNQVGEEFQNELPEPLIAFANLERVMSVSVDLAQSLRHASGKFVDRKCGRIFRGATNKALAEFLKAHPLQTSRLDLTPESALRPTAPPGDRARSRTTNRRHPAKHILDHPSSQSKCRTCPANRRPWHRAVRSHSNLSAAALWSEA